MTGVVSGVWSTRTIVCVRGTTRRIVPRISIKGLPLRCRHCCAAGNQRERSYGSTLQERVAEEDDEREALRFGADDSAKKMKTRREPHPDTISKYRRAISQRSTQTLELRVDLPLHGGQCAPLPSAGGGRWWSVVLSASPGHN